MKILDELGRVIKREESISTFIDFTLEEVLPAIFKEKVEIAYKSNKKQVDYVSRHII